MAVPLILHPVEVQVCRDLSASDCYLASIATFDRVRDRLVFPAMHQGIEPHCSMYEACQCPKLHHRRTPIPTARVPVQRPWRLLASDPVEYTLVNRYLLPRKSRCCGSYYSTSHNRKQTNGYMRQGEYPPYCYHITPTPRTRSTFVSLDTIMFNRLTFTASPSITHYREK